MKRTFLLSLSLFVAIIAGSANAQMHNSGGPDSDMNIMMNQNMSKMATMMEKMSKVLSTGKMTAEHQKKCAEIMNHMSDMMTAVGSKYDTELGKIHEKQLKEDDVFLEFLDTRYTH